MKNWFIRNWRRLMNRCAVCGAKRKKPDPWDFHSHGPFCRSCNKAWNWAKAYGASDQRTREMLYGSSLHR